MGPPSGFRLPVIARVYMGAGGRGGCLGRARSLLGGRNTVTTCKGSRYMQRGRGKPYDVHMWICRFCA